MFAKKKVFLWCLLIVFTLSACTCSPESNENSEASSVISSPESNENSEASSVISSPNENDSSESMVGNGMELWQSGKHFSLYYSMDHACYQYSVTDISGQVIDSGKIFSPRCISFKEDQYWLSLVQNHGNAQFEVEYFDIEKGKKSSSFHSPIATSKQFVAYFEYTEEKQIVLVVQDIFNPSLYKKAFSAPFSGLVFHATCEASFSKDEKELTVTYWRSPDEKLVTEVFEIV